MTTLQDRIRRAEHAVQVQQAQASGAKMGAAVSIGATIFGALLGRKAISTGTLGRATTAARGVERMGRESGDVSRASENVTALETQLSELESAMDTDLQSVSADWDLSNEPFDRVLVKPKRGGVSVQLVALVWVRPASDAWSELASRGWPLHGRSAARRCGRIDPSRARGGGACRAGPDRERRQPRASKLRALGDQDVPGAAASSKRAASTTSG